MATHLQIRSRRHQMLKPILTLGLAGVLLFARDEATVKRVQDAAETFQEIMSIPDKAIPIKLLEKAQCIIIVPGMKKAALGVGGVYGRGFVSCLTPNAKWGPP